MSVFQADCPHCGTKSVAFKIAHARRAEKQDSTPWDTLAFCLQCSRSILATFITPDRSNPVKWLETGGRGLLLPPTIYPSLPSTGAPEHTPENVAEFYRQGMENLPGAYDAAGSMFRKVLDTGLKAKFPDIKKGNLKERIQKAADRHELTPELAEWAHQIRLDGNDAAHDEEVFSEGDVKRLQTFTELVLIYLFKLPGMLKDARGDAENETGESRESSSGQPPASDSGVL